MTGIGAVAAWTSPALVVAVVARVTAGGVEAPLFVLAVLAAPLLALLAGPGPGAARSGFASTLAVVTVTCVLGAGFRAVTDLGHVVGLESGATLGSAVALVLVTTVWPGRRRLAAVALVLGAAALAVALGILGAAVGAAPWTAWSRVASQGAFELGERSAWTREGARFLQPVTLTFPGPHRITAATPAVFRVSEHDREAVVVREWRLAAGESLMLRPGDTLSIPAGARVRFERGKRVPGTPVSGVAWADRPVTSGARLVAWWLGLTLTLVGGALTVVRVGAPLSRAAALLAPAAVLGVALAATCWGIYAVDAAPELSIGAPAAAALVDLAPVVADEPWRSRLLAAIVLALVALLLGSAASLRQRLVDLAVRDSRRLAASTGHGVLGTALWILLVGAAAAASVAVTDGWSLLIQGAGLAAATVLGPLVATGDRPGFERAHAKGALAGATLFILATAFAHWPAIPPGVVDAVAQYPALVAVPGAWLVATLSRGAGPARREMVAAVRRR
jgi:hypothetical protein